jgi:hypothetical protein
MATRPITAARPELLFPAAEVERRLRSELQKVASEAGVLRPEWEPLLDSRRVVGTLLVIEDLFPGCKIPPDKVVQRGGYRSVDEAIKDMLAKIERIVTDCNQRKGRND